MTTDSDNMHPESKSRQDGDSSGFVVDGHVHRPRWFTMAELLCMDMVEESDLLHACGTGEPKGHIKHCRGVLLTDVLNVVDVRIADHNDTKKMYLRIASSDGYTTVFSWQELFNTQVGEGVMIVLERDGRKLHAEGYADLFSSKDYLSGPRYVKRLTGIKVLMIE